MREILFTTGATVTFKQLIETIVNYDFIVETIIGNGINRMVIQYGNEIEAGTGANLSEVFFKQCLADSKLMELLQMEVLLGEQEKNEVRYSSKKYRGFEMTVFPFTSDICQIISESDVVISHAGTGSIVDTLRLDKPLVVVTNGQLMNNHQEEVADELVKLGYCAKVTIEELKQGTFKSRISGLLSGNQAFTKLPKCTNHEVERIIHQELVK